MCQGQDQKDELLALGINACRKTYLAVSIESVKFSFTKCLIGQMYHMTLLLFNKSIETVQVGFVWSLGIR